MISTGISITRPVGFGVRYHTEGIALDLTSAFFEGSASVRDKSKVVGNKDAVLYTGHFVMTDGAQGRIDIDLSGVSLTDDYGYLTLRIRPKTNTFGCVWNGTVKGRTDLIPDVWQEVRIGDFYVPVGGVLSIAWDGFDYYEADLSDLRAYAFATDNVVGHWELNTSTDINATGLAGLPCPDSSGNGYHGTYTLGCNGEGGEGMDADVARIEGLDDAQWLNGVDTRVDFPIGNIPTGSSERAFTFDLQMPAVTGEIELFGYGNNSSAQRFDVGVLNGAFQIRLSGGVVTFGSNLVVNNYYSASLSLPFGATTAGELELEIDGVPVVNNGSALVINTGTDNLFRLGSYAVGSDGIDLKGVLLNFKSFSDGAATSSVLSVAGRGDNPWQDTSGNDNHGTPSGNFLTVGQKRATIIQTAGMNWNRYSWDGLALTLDSDGDFLVPESDANDQIDAYGTAILNPRPNNYVMNFWGEGEYADCGNDASLDLTTAFTIELWGDLMRDGTTIYGILVKGNYTTNTRAYRIATHSGGAQYLRVDLSSDGGAAVTSLGDCLIAGFHCYHVVYDGSRVTFYRDGALCVTVGTSTSSIFATPDPLYIGRNGNDADPTDRPMTGQLGSDKIYPYTLTDEQVLENYESQKGKWPVN